MHETAAMLEVRLALIDKIRMVERDLCREDLARTAAQLVRSHAHDLGNHIQIVKLAAMELERRGTSEAELTADLRTGAEHASAALASLFRAIQAEPRTDPGPAVVPAVAAAAELAQGALAARFDLQAPAGEGACSHATGEELEAIVLAALLDARAATRITLVVRQREVEGKPWLELIRLDDRQGDGHRTSLIEVAERVAVRSGGEVSLAPGRNGLELAIALPVVGRAV